MIRKATIAGKPAAQYWADKRAESLKKKPLKRTAIKKTSSSLIKKSRKSIKNKSKKQSKLDREYMILRNDFLLDNPVCQCGREGCVYEATEVHHKKGRGKFMLAVKYFMALCWSCHKWINEHNEEALEKGWSISRLAIEEVDIEDGTKIEIPEQLK